LQRENPFPIIAAEYSGQRHCRARMRRPPAAQHVPIGSQRPFRKRRLSIRRF
jgi:hypothetical protein